VAAFQMSFSVLMVNISLQAAGQAMRLIGELIQALKV
jgi:hypothetical protein